MESKLYEIIKLNYDDFERDVVHVHIGVINLPVIEDWMASMKNPLLVLPQQMVGEFLSASGRLKRNPYGFRPYENKYYLYHKLVDVEILNIKREQDMDRVVVIDRTDDGELIEDSFKIYYTC